LSAKPHFGQCVLFFCERKPHHLHLYQIKEGSGFAGDTMMKSIPIIGLANKETRNAKKNPHFLAVPIKPTINEAIK